MDTTNVKLIDLGLPSGTLWADRNIGADSPEDAGLYFQWGDTQGWRADQCSTGEGEKAFTWDDYKFDINNNLSKYNTTDGKLKLDPEDDAAVKLIGGDFHMPTKEQFIELFGYTTQKLILSDGTEILPKEGSDFAANGYFNWSQFDLGDRTVKGMKVIGNNGNELFFPASGFLVDGSAQYVGAEGNFWSASRSEGNAGNAWNLGFNSDGAEVSSNGGRCGGLPVRGAVGGGVA